MALLSASPCLGVRSAGSPVGPPAPRALTLGVELGNQGAALACRTPVLARSLGRVLLGLLRGRALVCRRTGNVVGHDGGEPLDLVVLVALGHGVPPTRCPQPGWLRCGWGPAPRVPSPCPNINSR